MGFMDKFKKMVDGIDEEDDNDFVVYSKPSSNKSSNQNINDYRSQAMPASPTGGNKIMSVHSQNQPAVVLVKPESFTEASSIADNINEKRTVVLNLESTNMEIARRLVDFLVGVAYANGATCKKVASKTFIFTPKNTAVIGEVSGDVADEGIIF